MVYLAPDTNVLLHYKLFTEIDWSAVATDSDIVLLFPLTVIHELDARKYTGVDERLKDRAQMVLRQIELADSNGLTAPSARIAIASSVSKAQLDQLHLDATSADDRILGELISFQRVHGVDVRLVTADYGARVKARAHGLTCIAPPPDLKRNDPDLRAKEIRELRERVARFESARPTLRPFLAIGDRRDAFEELLYQSVPPSADAIERHISRLSERHHHTPKQGDGIERDAWENYDRSWGEYLQQFRNYVAAYWKYKNRTFFLQVGAENMSDVSANNVRIRLHLPDGFDVADAHGYEQPRTPKPPTRPRTPYEMIFQSLTGLGSLDVGMTFRDYSRSIPAPRFYAPRIQKSNSYDIEFISPQVPQRDAVIWDPIVLTYDDAAEPTSFAIDYRVTIGNGFGVAEGALHVVFKQRPTP